MKKYTINLLFLLVIACQPLPKNSTQAEQTTRLKDAPFPVGVAVSMNKLKNLPVYREIVINEFSSITAENHMKIQHLQPQQGKFVWENGDYLVDFCRQYNKLLAKILRLLFSGSIRHCKYLQLGKNASQTFSFCFCKGQIGF